MVSTSSDFFPSNLGLLGPIVTSLALSQDQKKQKLIEAGIGLEWGDPRDADATGGSRGSRRNFV